MEHRYLGLSLALKFTMSPKVLWGNIPRYIQGWRDSGVDTANRKWWALKKYTREWTLHRVWEVTGVKALCPSSLSMDFKFKDSHQGDNYETYQRFLSLCSFRASTSTKRMETQLSPQGPEGHCDWPERGWGNLSSGRDWQMQWLWCCMHRTERPWGAEET